MISQNLLGLCLNLNSFESKSINNSSVFDESYIHSRFIGSKLKWDRRKIDDMILPVIKRMNTKEVCFLSIHFHFIYLLI
jgi:hypothetical protein